MIIRCNILIKQSNIFYIMTCKSEKDYIIATEINYTYIPITH
jgi:hypothetical protein